MTEFTPQLQEQLKAQAAIHPKLSEKDFIKFLLPQIVNIHGVKNVDMSIWLDIAGNPHRPIDVVDNQTKELLFTLPPLLARVPTDMPTKTRGGVDISAILDLYSKKRTTEHPAAADAWFEAEVAHTVIDRDEAEYVEYLGVLVKIYSRYGIPMNNLFGGADVAIDPTKTEGGEAAAAVDPEEQMTGQFDDL